MGAGMGGILCIGTGIGLAFYARQNWWWQGLIFAFIIVISHIVLRSQNFKDAKDNCKERDVEFSYKRYIIANQFISSAIVFTVFGMTVLAKHIFSI